MKNLFYTALFLTAIFSVGNIAYAQKPKTDCTDPTIKSLADGLKKGYEKQGMMVYQEAMLAMTSMEPAPIAVRLLKGQTYQLVFVGSERANKLIMELFDGKDKKIDELRARGEEYLTYSFTPDKTDIYLVTLYQKKGVKDMCGYFGVMKSNKQAAAPAKDTVIRRQAVTTPVQTKTSVKKTIQPAKTTVAPKTAKPAPVKTTTTTTTTKSTTTMPDNQRPNPNRTKATNAAKQQQ